jgi:hypothetical protein
MRSRRETFSDWSDSLSDLRATTRSRRRPFSARSCSMEVAPCPSESSRTWKVQQTQGQITSITPSRSRWSRAFFKSLSSSRPGRPDWLPHDYPAHHNGARRLPALRLPSDRASIYPPATSPGTSRGCERHRLWRPQNGRGWAAPFTNLIVHLAASAAVFVVCFSASFLFDPNERSTYVDMLRQLALRQRSS